eukprot:CAMPEP_0184287846 /NCGR_PEP_ID=MMETSP1049-20130417/259_1 /TAXON_ID=77928 /ORGANISM="Proteomonas sulcata, Strain CCMP704" /LENGTH=610 /DNA_ID=CAMNT_0026593933 /DNA_START=387 /DNA_END=2219 /DNA_ORIENTATION=-
MSGDEGCPTPQPMTPRNTRHQQSQQSHSSHHSANFEESDGSGSARRHSESRSSEETLPSPGPSRDNGWVNKVLRFLETEGQNLLNSICTRYKIPFDGAITSIPDGMLEQVAYSAIFNPALPKNPNGLPQMLMDIPGVSGFNMVFMKDRGSIFKSNFVAAKLKGVPFSLECRACSYCGSCFSGRFMELDSTHQRAGGWKEITDKIHAGKYSWKHLKGWRLCVPCFTNYGQKGTMDNANRMKIKEVVRCNPGVLKEGWADNPPKIVGSAGHDGDSPTLGKRSSDASEGSRPSKRRKDRAFEVGDSVEVFTENDWWEASVADVNADGGVLVHYVGGTADEDEWIPKHSNRIRLAGSTDLELDNPTPCATPQVTPIKDRDVSLPPCGALSEDTVWPQFPPKISPLLQPVDPDITFPTVTDDDDSTSAASEEPEESSAECLSYDVEITDKEVKKEDVLIILQLSVDGPDMVYQWFHGDEPIPHAQSSVLEVYEPGEAEGPISCCVQNAFGSSWVHCPFPLPSTKEDAQMTRSALSGLYQLVCRCGAIMQGSAEELCSKECIKCGAVCCGRVERFVPVRAKEARLSLDWRLPSASPSPSAESPHIRGSRHRLLSFQ